MAFLDKRGVVAQLMSAPRVVLELGCGSHKRNPAAIGVDALDYECVDIVGDVFEVLAAMPAGVVDEIYSAHFLEHVADVPRLLDDIARILKPGASLTIVVPHFSNPYFYSDITHRATFGLYSMSYFAEDRILARKVPSYQRQVLFDLAGVRLVFKSSPPFYLRHAVKKVVEPLVNLTTYTQELYEEMFANWFPCYEVRYALCRKAEPPKKVDG